MSNQNKVVRFRKRKNINIGIVVFLILFLYIAINVILYLTKDQLSIYEVHEGTTAIDNHITGLILRSEKLVYSSKAGYVVYYQKDGSRIARNSSIYAVNDNAIYNTDSGDISVSITKQDEAKIMHDISSFQSTYSDSNFASVYDFQENAQSTMIDILNNSMVSNSKMAGTSIEGTVKSKESGIIAYYMDHYEDVTPDSVTAKMFQIEKYKKTNLRTTDMIDKDTPVYKIITSEEWNLILPLTDAEYKKLEGKSAVEFTVLEDDYDMTAGLRLMKKGSGYYAVLTMNKDMSNYLNERYLEVKLDFDSVDGLKLPTSSVVEKKCYRVPKSYFTKGGDSNENGLILVSYSKNGDVKYPFKATDIYYKDNDYGYIDTNEFKAGTRIQSPENSKQYTLSKTKTLTGVYNVNLGYAVFKWIDILYQNDEYCIVKENTLNGLSAYDHIALDGKKAVNEQIIY